MLYKHTQIGKVILFAAIGIAALYLFFLLQRAFDFSGFTSVMLIVLLILVSFISLTVTIDDSHLHIAFGLFSKKFVLKEIATAKAVKNKWYYGWGIRLKLNPTTWIFNVSGFDAVEIIMKNGKIYRIGTDEPQKLEQALQQAIK
ncbi:MAG TPA: hypothetical protein VLK22_01180 [Candidatus Udaeobacter sp.]|nr:hypothetical protein [Candidatus Udaeobacter sp.]